MRSVERRVDPLPDAEDSSVRANGRFAIFVVDLTNRSQRSESPDANDFVLESDEGTFSVNLAEIPAASSYAVAKDLHPFADEIAPGATTSTILLFDIDPHAGRLMLDFLSSGKSIQIDECKCNLPSPVRHVG